MKQIDIPRTDLSVSSVILGLMRIGKMSDAEIRDLVGAGLDAGINMVDHADIYGGMRHHCETRFGEALRLTQADRERMVIQTKAGIREKFFDFSEEHLLRSVEGSLKALRTDYLDVFLLHRPDALVEPEEVASAFDKLHAAGKVRHFGVSNQSPGQIELLKTAVRQPLVVNQVQLSITHAPLVAEGVALNMSGLDQSIGRTSGLLDWSRKEGMTLQAWSPFQKSFFDGPFVGDRESHPELNDALDEIASAHGVTPTGVAVAWITRHPARMQVVLGTTKPGRVRECVAGAGVDLSRQEWYRLFRAAGHILP
ncbi:aldo/keto reductase [Rubellimicrobium roseum]|uniref:Aldo/keto reductase family oxidoreductase n=1 Tax=Rubellimicrobium roseum TaxID=687525 RepID=A0A5C4N7Y6_9RHOB|nr:aldo/keto reductase [Rubellimicrobium roseum]TNC64206.1 aldo/keto reductase family oxidoreductase [Rubellimicrobium roseum]